jgi:hypothetical protein
MTMSMVKALNKQWEKCLPMPLSASFMCQHFGLWKPKTAGNDLSELMSMEGIKRG